MPESTNPEDSLFKKQKENYPLHDDVSKSQRHMPDTREAKISVGCVLGYYSRAQHRLKREAIERVHQSLETVIELNQ